MNGGTDRIFPEPPHEIRGKTSADQAWIDETIEAGATCCGWAIRPRPPELDAAPQRVALAPAVKPPKAKKKRRTITDLLRRH